MAKIKIDITAPNPMHRKICQEYWKMASDSKKFQFTVEELCRNYSISVGELGKIVHGGSKVYDANVLCPNCHNFTVFFRSRAELTGYKSPKANEAPLCSTCTKSSTAVLKHEKGELQIKKARGKAQKMKVAFEGSVYESLSPLEFNFLSGIAILNNIESARRRLGISHDAAKQLLDKLDDLNLIDASGQEGLVYPELAEALKRMGFQSKVKSVFGSPKALEVYRYLKTRYLFVYPEIPICAFVPRESVEDLLTEKWHNSFYLSSRIDFVITNADGVPKFAIEYQGGYHEDSADQIEKDKLKRRILKEVGVHLIYVNYTDLSKLDNLA